jgi:hypothetical protein
MKDNEWSGLEKIPDSLLIKTLRIELGKQNAYIVELEDTIKSERAKEHSKIKKQTLEIDKLNLTVKDYLNKIVDLTKRNETIHKQLIQLLKKSIC